MTSLTPSSVNSVNPAAYVANPEVGAARTASLPVLRLPKTPVVFVAAVLVASAVMLPAEFLEGGSDDHLLLVWLAVWTVVFAVLSVLATPFTLWVQELMAGYSAWRVARRQAEEDRKLWAVALTDARVMSDLSRAMAAGANEDVRGYN
jgi:hypothetical protein